MLAAACTSWDTFRRGRTRHGAAKVRYGVVPGDDPFKLAGLFCSIVDVSIKSSYITEQHLLDGTEYARCIRQDPTTWLFVPGLGWPPATRTQVAAMSEAGKPQGHWLAGHGSSRLTRRVWRVRIGVSVVLLPVWEMGKRTPVSCGTTVRVVSGCRCCEAARE